MIKIPTADDWRLIDDQSADHFSSVRDRWASMLIALTGQWVSPWDVDRTVAGLDSYLERYGIDHFSGLELTKPHRPDLLDTFPQCFTDTVCGKVLLPGRQAYPRLVLLALVLERLRDWIKAPITVQSVWRPSAYNAAVKGQPGSDHLFACAADLDIQRERYDDAMRWVKKVSDPWLLSVGYHSHPRQVDKERMHIGILAPPTCRKGSARFWDYDASGVK